MRSYGKIGLHQGAWLLWDVEPHVVIRLKALFPRIPRHSSGPFTLPSEPITYADLAWFCARYPMAGDAAHLDALERGRQGFEQIQAEAGRIMAADYQPPRFGGLKPGQQIRQHQGRNAALLQRFGGLLVADEMGEGKTYTGAAGLLLPGALPATLVVPPHLTGQWATKLREFTTLQPLVVKGTKPYALPAADVRIFGYTQLAGWVDVLELLGTGLALFDEIHRLRNGTDTGQGQAAMRLTQLARLRMGLTGTPIFNYGDEIWNIMQFLRPEVLGGRADFLREWCGGTRQVSDPEALGTYLREQHAMVRKKGEAPPANVLVQTVSHDVRQLASVEDLAQRLAATAKYSNAPLERGQAIRELDMLLRQQTGVAKAKAVADFVRLIVEAGEPVVLFGWHRQVYDVWQQELRDLGVVLYTGTESPKQKQAAVDAFLAGHAKVFVMSLRSGEGLDGIQAVCKVAVIGELDWSPSVHQQCIFRINREGQPCWPERVTAFYLVADDGSDPAIMEVCGIKASQAHGIVDPGLGPQRVDRDQSALERLVDRYLNRGRGVAA